MAYKEKVENEIKEDGLRRLWEKIYEAYEQGGIEQIKSTLDEQIKTIHKDYQGVLSKLEKVL